MESQEGKWTLPPARRPLPGQLAELQGALKGGIDEERNADHEEVKGLKFISSKLLRLFERNRRLKYSHVSRILIDNFAGQANDSRNIKRRVYDAINVMVAAGVFSKNGDNLEKKESPHFRQKVEVIKSGLSTELSALQTALNTKKQLLTRLARRRQKLQELLERNQKHPTESKLRVEEPLLVSLREGTRRVRLLGPGGEAWAIEMPRSSRGRHRPSACRILRDQEYLEYL